MRGKRVCGLHGGRGGGPKGERSGAYRTGRYTAEAERRRRREDVRVNSSARLDQGRSLESLQFAGDV
jgi:hypothetical protein